MMDGGSAHWVGAFVALSLGLTMGLLRALFVPFHREAMTASMSDLEEQVGHCLAQLRDLKEQQGRLVPAAYEAQKLEFETRAASLLHSRNILAQKVKPPRSPEETSPVMQFLAKRPQLRGALWGGGIVGIAAMLYGLVVSQQHEQPQGPGGGAVTASQNEEVEHMRSLMKHLREAPDDVDTLLSLAHLLLKNQMISEAALVNSRALALVPNNIEAQTHGAVLQAAKGQGDEAQRELAAILARDPKFSEAWFFRGMLSMQRGDQGTAADSFKHFVQVAPDGPQKERVKNMLHSMQQ